MPAKTKKKPDLTCPECGKTFQSPDDIVYVQSGSADYSFSLGTRRDRSCYVIYEINNLDCQDDGGTFYCNHCNHELPWTFEKGDEILLHLLKEEASGLTHKEEKKTMNRKKMLYDIEYAPHKFIEIELYYKPGGMNYFSGQSELRGYYLGVTPVEKSNGMSSFTAFSGTCTLINAANRFSQKKLDALAVDRPTIQRLLDDVNRKNKLEVKLNDNR